MSCLSGLPAQYRRIGEGVSDVIAETEPKIKGISQAKRVRTRSSVHENPGDRQVDRKRFRYSVVTIP